MSEIENKNIPDTTKKADNTAGNIEVVQEKPINLDSSVVIHRGKSLRQVNNMFGFDKADSKNW